MHRRPLRRGAGPDGLGLLRGRDQVFHQPGELGREWQEDQGVDHIENGMGVCDLSRGLGREFRRTGQGGIYRRDRGHQAGEVASMTAGET